MATDSGNFERGLGHKRPIISTQIATTKSGAKSSKCATIMW
jgi:hypothetical protein